MTNYPPPPPSGYGYSVPPNHPQATTALVLGILSLVLCQLLGPFAWSMGGKAVAEIDAAAARGGAMGGRSSAQAGKILGIISTVLLGLSLLVLLLFVVLGVSMR